MFNHLLAFMFHALTLLRPFTLVLVMIKNNVFPLKLFYSDSMPEPLISVKFLNCFLFYFLQFSYDKVVLKWCSFKNCVFAIFWVFLANLTISTILKVPKISLSLSLSLSLIHLYLPWSYSDNVRIVFPDFMITRSGVNNSAVLKIAFFTYFIFFVANLTISTIPKVPTSCKIYHSKWSYNFL